MAYADPYITSEAARLRLLEYSITATPTLEELRMASDSLDIQGEFIGERYSATQKREFPRTVTVDGDTENVVPQRILDWVALTAFELQEDDDPPVKHERIESLSTTFTRGRRSQPDRFKKFLLRDYRDFNSFRIV